MRQGLRKRLLVAAGLLVLIVTLGFASGQGEEGAAGGEPVELRIGATTGIALRRMTDLSSEFTEQTGIRVEVEHMRAPDLNTKVRLESTAKSGYYDIVRTSSGQIDLWVEPGWVIPLDEYIANTSGFDLDDWIPSLLEVGKRDGKIYGLPFTANVYVLAYRTDLFGDPEEQAAFQDEYGYELTPPTTTEEWLDTAEFFTRDDMSGFAIGQREPAGHFWPWYGVETFGVTFIDTEQYVSGLDDPRTKDAFEWMLEMQETMPDGVMAMPYKEETSHYMEGRLAMAPVFAAEAMDVLDPEKSRVHDRTGFIAFPREPDSGLETGQAHLGGGTLSIHAHSEHPDAAWQFMAWIQGKEMAVRQAEMGTVIPRKSVMENEQLFEEVPKYELFFPAYLEMLEYGAQLRPGIPEGDAMMEQLALNWGGVVRGEKSIDEAISDTHDAVNELFEEGGYR